MTRILPLALLLAAAGCTRYEGPVEVYNKYRRGDRPDLPGYTIEEQKARGKERLPLIDDDPTLYPAGGVDRPGGIGR
jgi:hypothetical protein